MSIVTPVLNRVEMVERALESVAELRDATDWPVEHLAIDGGSTDGTLELLREWRPQISIFSRPDRSLYEAINRGIDSSTGTYLCLLNSDDQIIADGLAALLGRIESEGFPDAAWGGVEIRRSNRADRGRVVPGSASGPLSPLSIMLGVPYINARVFRRTVFDRVGRFDPSFRMAGDREFLMRLIRSDPTTCWIDDPVYRYLVHDGSLTIRADGPDRRALEERLRIADACSGNGEAAAIRIAAGAGRAWSEFLLRSSADTDPVKQLARWRSWRDAPSRVGLFVAVLAKVWLRARTTLSTRWSKQPTEVVCESS